LELKSKHKNAESEFKYGQSFLFQFLIGSKALMCLMIFLLLKFSIYELCKSCDDFVAEYDFMS